MPFKSKEVQREYHKKHYAMNRQYYIDKSKRHRMRLKDWYQDLKGQLYCLDCGETDPRCLCFHHRDRGEKVSEVSVMVQRELAKATILAEIEKCDVLCMNCHAKVERVLPESVEGSKPSRCSNGRETMMFPHAGAARLFDPYAPRLIDETVLRVLEEYRGKEMFAVTEGAYNGTLFTEGA